MSSLTPDPRISLCERCGSRAFDCPDEHLPNGDVLWSVTCENPECNACVQDLVGQEAAIAAWNRRAPPAAAMADIEAAIRRLYNSAFSEGTNDCRESASSASLDKAHAKVKSAMDTLRVAIAADKAAAVAAEREACAVGSRHMVQEPSAGSTYLKGYNDACRDIDAAILARRDKP